MEGSTGGGGAADLRDGPAGPNSGGAAAELIVRLTVIWPLVAAAFAVLALLLPRIVLDGEREVARAVSLSGRVGQRPHARPADEFFRAQLPALPQTPLPLPPVQLEHAHLHRQRPPARVVAGQLKGWL